VPGCRHGGEVRSSAVIATALLASGIAQAATTYEATPDNYRRLVDRLRAGDTLALAPGEYRDGLRLHNLAGEPGRPITITGPARGPAARFVDSLAYWAPGGAILWRP